MYIYNADYTLRAVSDLKHIVNPYPTKSSPETFEFECKFDENCFDNQVYIFRMEEPGKCISDDYFSCDYAGATASAEPVITSIPVTVNTTAIEGTATSASAQLLVYINGKHEAAVLAAATVPYAFSASVSGLALGDTIELRQIEEGKCVSEPLMILVTREAYPPLLTSSPCHETYDINTISGTSVEAEGTEITVFQLNPSRTAIGTTTVQNDGTWTLGGLSLFEGDIVTAAVTDGLYLTQSVDGDTITLEQMTDVSAYSISINPPTEGNTQVTGFISGGTYPLTLHLYADDILIGQTVIYSPSDWTVNGLNAFDLNTDAVINVTVEKEDMCESTYSSATAVVQCAGPAPFTISADTTHICEGSAAEITVENSEEGIYYEPVLLADSSTFGYGKMGTGGAITLNTYLITDSAEVTVMASRIPIGSCVIYADNVIDFAFIDSLHAPVASHEQTLCYNSLVDDISVALNGFGSINWYESPTAEDPLDPTTLIEDGVTYYAEARTNGCYSEIEQP